MINEPVEGGLGEGAADLLAQMGGAGAFGGDDVAAGEGEGASHGLRSIWHERLAATCHACLRHADDWGMVCCQAGAGLCCVVLIGLYLCDAAVLVARAAA